MSRHNGVCDHFLPLAMAAQYNTNGIDDQRLDGWHRTQSRSQTNRERERAIWWCGASADAYTLVAMRPANVWMEERWWWLVGVCGRSRFGSICEYDACSVHVCKQTIWNDGELLLNRCAYLCACDWEWSDRCVALQWQDVYAWVGCGYSGLGTLFLVFSLFFFSWSLKWKISFLSSGL